MAEFRQMGLSECAQFDKNNDAKNRLTGWGKICKERQEKGISRKAQRDRKKTQR